MNGLKGVARVKYHGPAELVEKAKGRHGMREPEVRVSAFPFVEKLFCHV